MMPNPTTVFLGTGAGHGGAIGPLRGHDQPGPGKGSGGGGAHEEVGGGEGGRDGGGCYGGRKGEDGECLNLKTMSDALDQISSFETVRTKHRKCPECGGKVSLHERNREKGMLTVFGKEGVH